jgi:TetR/AcrR family transcriptional regulator, mexJK operon transcriptional repressor
LLLSDDQVIPPLARLGRRADPAKEAAILTAARHAFLELPFDRVSMDSVAARANVSKATIYAKYQSKEGLFVATMNEQCGAIYEQARSDTRAGGPLDVALRDLGTRFMTMILSPDITAMHGVMMQAAQDRPELTQLYYKSVVETSITTLAETLDIAISRDLFACDDTHRAAVQFIAMIQGVYRYEHELGVATQSPPKDLEAYVADCVGLFLRGYLAQS